MDEKESSKRYYQGQVDQVTYHNEFPAQIKISSINSTKWMDLNAVSAEVIVKKLIEEFKLEIK